jgi:hypothetical protein
MSTKNYRDIDEICGTRKLTTGVSDNVRRDTYTDILISVAVVYVCMYLHTDKIRT